MGKLKLYVPAAACGAIVTVPLVFPLSASFPTAAPVTPRVSVPALAVTFALPTTTVPLALYHVIWPAVPLDTVPPPPPVVQAPPASTKLLLASMLTQWPLVSAPVVVTNAVV